MVDPQYFLAVRVFVNTFKESDTIEKEIMTRPAFRAQLRLHLRLLRRIPSSAGTRMATINGV